MYGPGWEAVGRAVPAALGRVAPAAKMGHRRGGLGAEEAEASPSLQQPEDGMHELGTLALSGTPHPEVGEG